MPKVSVVVPIYNVEDYLDQALESLKRQTLSDMEFICVNDGSTDSSLEILKRWADGDDRFVIIDKENGGYGVGMNVGMERATGEYIGILEPDDFVPLHMFEDLYLIASEHDLDFVKADFFRFTTNEHNGNMSLVYNHLDRTNTYYNQIVNPSEMPELTYFIMNTWSGIYKNSFIKENHITHNTTPGASFQDNGFFWKTTVLATRAMFIDKPYYMNRRDNPNSSVNRKDKVYVANIEYDYIKDFLMDECPPEIWERFKGYFTNKRVDNYLFTLSRISDEFKREYVDRISNEFKRAQDLGELDYDLIPKTNAQKIRLLIDNKDDFYLKYVLLSNSEKQLLAAQKEIKKLRSSKSFRIGKALTAIPRKLKKAVKD